MPNFNLEQTRLVAKASDGPSYPIQPCNYQTLALNCHQNLSRPIFQNTSNRVFFITSSRPTFNKYLHRTAIIYGPPDWNCHYTNRIDLSATVSSLNSAPAKALGFLWTIRTPLQKVGRKADLRQHRHS